MTFDLTGMCPGKASLLLDSSNLCGLPLVSTMSCDSGLMLLMRPGGLMAPLLSSNFVPYGRQAPYGFLCQ